MLTAWKDDIDGWAVTGNCEEHRPDGWRPGDPIQYAVRAKAELTVPFRERFKSDSPHILRFPKEGFAAIYGAAVEGQAAATQELAARIKELKK